MDHELLAVVKNIEAKLDHVIERVDDMQPRVEMLNHWHDEVNEELERGRQTRAELKARLKVVDRSSKVAAATGVAKVIFDGLRMLAGL